MAKIEIGSIVKSLDFVGNEEDYFVGTVIEIREEMIKARIAYQVVNGKIRNTDAKFVSFPKQGLGMLDDIGPRVFVRDSDISPNWEPVESV
jgi:hypothetical protein